MFLSCEEKEIQKKRKDQINKLTEEYNRLGA